MRFVSVALALAIVAGSAFAQGMRDTGSGGKGRHAAQSAEQQRIDQEKKKAAEDAYKAALKSIPDSKIKNDPWRGVR
jgi:capsule polysaccharide export protein KpsE/RkpR